MVVLELKVRARRELGRVRGRSRGGSPAPGTAWGGSWGGYRGRAVHLVALGVAVEFAVELKVLAGPEGRVPRGRLHLVEVVAGRGAGLGRGGALGVGRHAPLEGLFRDPRAVVPIRFPDCVPKVYTRGNVGGLENKIKRGAHVML